jgi:phosphoribosyl 1,2-cyclic phosphate phosphodiesterase
VKVTILGCGAAGGVPMISAGWGRCDPHNPRNRRTRPSILIDIDGKKLLVDTSPDLREQLLAAEIGHLDAVLYTHAHADHVHGIDDLREINRAMRAAIPVFGTKATLDEIGRRFDYVFAPMMSGADVIYKPWLVPHVIEGAFQIGDISVTAFDQDHGFSRTTGFRIGPFAYSTDVLELPEESLAQLHGLDLWVVGCLLDVPHNTHAHVAKALAWRERVKPKRMIITHMSPRLDYAVLASLLPDGVEPAYDGMVLSLS